MNERSSRAVAKHAASCVLAVVALTAGCSDDDRPSSSPPPADVPAQDASTGFDAASITPRPDLCEGLARQGDAVPELELRGDAPAPLGGTIVPGTYDLAELYAYAGEQPGGSDEETPGSKITGRAGQGTLVVTQYEMRFLEARGAAESDAKAWPEQARAVLYRVDGTSLVSTAVCPTTALPVSLPFSAVGTGLAIFVDPTHREVYTLRP
ncbi:MAG: hypothetical protein KF819_08770 [Labilithrix sp.]|nr:hypothetical protein [Labilithrix sp.]